MGLEVPDKDARPDHLNPDWPASGDDIKYGDNHIRLVKVTSVNFYNDYLKLLEDFKLIFVEDNEGNVTSKVKTAEHADNAERLGKQLADRYSLINGTYEELRAQATTKEDVGLLRVENWYPSSGLTDTAVDHYARAADTADLNLRLAGLDANMSTIYGLKSHIIAAVAMPPGSDLIPGNARAGSELRPCDLVGAGWGTLPGTWQAQCYIHYDQYEDLWRPGLWVRTL